MTQAPDNAEIARILDAVGDLLEAEDANPFRIRSYRRVAGALRTHAARSRGSLSR